MKGNQSKAISLKDVNNILKKYKKEFEDKYKVKEIGVFGSYVKGEQKDKSDIDILVEFYKIPDLFKFLELEEYLEKLLRIKVDLVRKKAIRPELKDNIIKEVSYV